MTTFPDVTLYPSEDLFSSGIGGGVYKRGTSLLIYLGETPLIAAYLGDLLIWDGSISAFVSVPIATATAQSPAPTVVSQPATIVVPIATATADTAEPTVTASSSVTAPLATASATATSPTLSVSASITAPIATASAAAIPPLSDANIDVPTATATAQAPVPVVATTGSSNIGVPIATATALAPDSVVAVSATVAVPIATASAAATAAVVSVSATRTPPIATATATATAPVAAVATFAASGMTKNSTMTWATSTTWVTIASWTANTGTYPGSSVGSDRLNVQGTKTNATLTAAVPFSGGLSLRQHRCRLVDQSGNVIATGSIVAADSGTCTVTATGVDLAAITSIGLEMNANGGSGGTVTSGSTCYLTIT